MIRYMKRKQSTALLERNDYSSLEPVPNNYMPQPNTGIEIVELEGGSLPLGLALAILAALDKDCPGMADLGLRPEDVRTALLNAARRVLDEPVPNSVTIHARM